MKIKEMKFGSVKTKKAIQVKVSREEGKRV